jgi:tRNA uridine 5-carboxymethylaminomethyl modification enzyme
MQRQDMDVAAMRRDEHWEIPEDFDYSALSGLSTELKIKLTRARPETLAQAGRVDGVTPAALTLLLMRLRQMNKARSA